MKAKTKKMLIAPRGGDTAQGTWPIGQRIVAVRAMTQGELQREGWFPRLHEQALTVELELGVLYAACDEEGNGPGAMFGRDGMGALVSLFPPDYEGVTEERAPSLDQKRLNDCYNWIVQARTLEGRGGLHLRPAGRRSQTAKKGRKT